MTHPTIGIDSAIALTGFSKRTLWRRLAEGVCRKIENEEGGRTRLLIADILPLAGLSLNDEACQLLTAADAGNSAAQRDIGQWLLLKGQQRAAVYWLDLAAAQGEADAMQCLGQCYAAGAGVEKDDNLALMWIAKAAAHGHMIARAQMAHLQA